MKILFAGGGTLGPVTPLLAVAEGWRIVDSSVEFVWVGTPSGPEAKVVEGAVIRFVSIPVARLTRYPSFEWIMLPVNLFRAARRSWTILKDEKPSLVASAGGFTGVPLIVAARILGIPSWLHQQDVRPILSSRLVVPFVTWISTAWESSLAAFPKGKSAWVGNPVRASETLAGHRVTRTYDDGSCEKILINHEGSPAGHSVTRSRESSVRRFGLDLSRQTVLVFGGGGGALFLNRLMETIGREVAETANVIHIVGTGKMTETLEQMGGRYVAVELLTDAMSAALDAADLVVCRAGMGTISELASRSTAAIVVPLPNSPQEDNALVLESNGAALVLRESATSPQEYLEAIRGLLRDDGRRRALGANLGGLLRTDVAATIVERLRKIVPPSGGIPPTAVTSLRSQ